MLVAGGARPERCTTPESCGGGEIIGGGYQRGGGRKEILAHILTTATIVVVGGWKYLWRMDGAQLADELFFSIMHHRHFRSGGGGVSRNGNRTTWNWWTTKQMCF